MALIALQALPEHLSTWRLWQHLLNSLMPLHSKGNLQQLHLVQVLAHCWDGAETLLPAPHQQLPHPVSNLLC